MANPRYRNYLSPWTFQFYMAFPQRLLDYLVVNQISSQSAEVPDKTAEHLFTEPIIASRENPISI